MANLQCAVAALDVGNTLRHIKENAVKGMIMETFDTPAEELQEINENIESIFMVFIYASTIFEDKCELEGAAKKVTSFVDVPYTPYNYETISIQTEEAWRKVETLLNPPIPFLKT